MLATKPLVETHSLPRTSGDLKPLVFRGTLVGEGRTHRREINSESFVRIYDIDATDGPRFVLATEARMPSASGEMISSAEWLLVDDARRLEAIVISGDVIACDETAAMAWRQAISRCDTLRTFLRQCAEARAARSAQEKREREGNERAAARKALEAKQARERAQRERQWPSTHSGVNA